MEIDINTIEDLETLLSWNISKNHTGRWGAIQGKVSRSYSFMHEDKEEVLKWLIKNYNQCKEKI